MNQIIESYKLISLGLTQLFNGLVEVVLHDLTTNKIVFIVGNLSKRKDGDDSHLSDQDKQLKPGLLGPYRNFNPDGRGMKSLSVVLDTSAHHQRLMMCINLDTSKFQEIQGFLNLLTHQEEKPIGHYFTETWQDQIHVYIYDELKRMKKTMEQLSRAEKKTLIEQLRRHGAFAGKNAANYIAKIFNISRATVYGYLKATIEEPA